MYPHVMFCCCNVFPSALRCQGSEAKGRVENWKQEALFWWGLRWSLKVLPESNSSQPMLLCVHLRRKMESRKIAPSPSAIMRLSGLVFSDFCAWGIARLHCNSSDLQVYGEKGSEKVNIVDILPGTEWLLQQTQTCQLCPTCLDSWSMRGDISS